MQALPKEIFLNIIDIASDKETKLSLGSASSGVREYAVSQVLKNLTESNIPEADALSFFTMLSASPDRGALVTTLHISIPLLDRAAEAETMALALRSLVNTTVLTLERSEDALAAYPQVTSALASLPSIRELCIKEAAEGAVRLLESMISPIVVLCVSGRDRKRSVLTSAQLSRFRNSLTIVAVHPACEPTPFVPNPAARLTDVTVAAGAVDDGGAGFVPLGVLPAVRVLLAIGGVVGRSGDYILAYPATTYLDVGCDPDAPFGEEEIATRLVNQAETRSPHNAGLWRDMELVTGGLVELCVFANHAQTRVLKIAGGIQPGLSELLPLVVDDNVPQTLNLSLVMPFDGEDAKCLEVGANVLPMVSVRCLSMDVTPVDGADVTSDTLVASVLEFTKLFPSLAHLYMQFCVPEGYARALAMVQNLDVDALACDVVRLNPALNVYCVSFGDVRRAYQVTRTPVSYMIQDMDSVAAWQVMADEGMLR